MSVPAEPVGVAQPVGVNLAQLPRLPHEGIRRGDAVLAVQAVVAAGIDAQDLAVGLGRLRRERACGRASAAPRRDVEQAVVLVTGPSERVEVDLLEAMNLGLE